MSQVTEALKKLTPASKNILRIIAASGRVGSSGIAKKLGKVRLIPADRERLKAMEESGIIRREVDSSPSLHYVYLLSDEMKILLERSRRERVGS